MPLEDLQKHLFLLRDRDATNHLLRVSAGLDSLVMGEGQILAQARDPRRLHAGPAARAARRHGRRLGLWPPGGREPTHQRGATRRHGTRAAPLGAPHTPPPARAAWRVAAHVADARALQRHR